MLCANTTEMASRLLTSSYSAGSSLPQPDPVFSARLLLTLRMPGSYWTPDAGAALQADGLSPPPILLTSKSFKENNMIYVEFLKIFGWSWIP